MDELLGDDEGVRVEAVAAVDGPTFEDLAIDDSLSDLDRVTKYVCSNIALQRVIHVKMLQETASSVGFQATCDRLIPLLQPLVCDEEYVVRQHVAFQFPPLCQFLVSAGEDAGYRVLLQQMIPLVSKLVSDWQHEVRTAASESLVEMAALVKEEDMGQHILTIVLPLAHDDDNEQFRISAVTLYNGLAEHFGPELCQQFCVPELISLSEDPVFRVRKSTAQSFSNVCKIAGHELSRERLIPSFQRLAKDDIWGVRKACAECLVSISQSLAPEDRGPLLIPLFESFVKDSSRWVRLAAYQSLGPFLATLLKEHITDELIEYFVCMATTASSQLGGNAEVDIKFHCAFNFPAVVSILGKAKWHKLSPTFELLSNDSYWKIRRTFAYSLHELARMLGQEITESQLSTAFDTYLHDVQDVRLGAMLHFADFLDHVSPSFRESYLPVLTEFDSLESEETKWRFREVLSRQLVQLCQTFTPEATFSVIYPLVMKLVTDPVAAVRQESYHACPFLVARIRSNQEWLDTVVAKFTSLAMSTHFTDRQSFLKICRGFLTSTDSDYPSQGDDDTSRKDVTERNRNFFCSQLSAVFFTLASDGVSNVRLLFADIIVAYQDYFKECPLCPEELKEHLRTNVFQNAEDLLVLLPSPTQVTIPIQAKTTVELTKEVAEACLAAEESAPTSEEVANASEPEVNTDAIDVAVMELSLPEKQEQQISPRANTSPSACRESVDVPVDPVA